VGGDSLVRGLRLALAAAADAAAARPVLQGYQVRLSSSPTAVLFLACASLTLAKGGKREP